MIQMLQSESQTWEAQQFDPGGRIQAKFATLSKLFVLAPDDAATSIGVIDVGSGGRHPAGSHHEFFGKSQEFEDFIRTNSGHGHLRYM